MRETSAGSLCAVIIVCFSLTSLGSMTILEDSANSGWQIAAPVESDDSGSALYPQVAVDGSGNAIAVWQQHDGVRNNIWSNRFAVEEGWGEATLIEANNSGNAVNPQVAVDNSGNATAVWQQDNGTRHCIYSNRYVVGTGWGSATLIEYYNSEGAFNPQIAVDDSGNAMVVWEQDDGTFDSIYSNRYVVGTGWEGATLIGTANNWWEEHAGDPQVAVDGWGNAIVVWKQYDGAHYNIWSNRYVVGVGWGSATLIEANDSGSAAAPQVAVDNFGNVIAVWEQSDGFRESICSNRYAVATGWGNATLVEADDIGDNSLPDVAADGSGNAIAVWVNWEQSEDVNPGYESGIKANRYVAGTGWQTATIVEECSSGMIGFPKVAVNDWGNAIVVWTRVDVSHISICSTRYDAETGWSPTASIGTGESLNAGDSQVAFDSSGNAIAVWWQYDGATHDIWSNRYVEPTPSSSSLALTIAVAVALAVAASTIIVSTLWIRKRKADRSSRSIEEEEDPPSSS